MISFPSARFSKSGATNPKTLGTPYFIIIPYLVLFVCSLAPHCFAVTILKKNGHGLIKIGELPSGTQSLKKSLSCSNALSDTSPPLNEGLPPSGLEPEKDVSKLNLSNEAYARSFAARRSKSFPPPPAENPPPPTKIPSATGEDSEALTEKQQKSIFFRARSLLKQGHFESALQTINTELLEFVPNNIQGLGLKAQILLKLQRYEEGLIAIEKRIQLSSEPNIAALGIKTMILFHLGLLNEANATADAQLAINPLDQRALGMKGRILIQLGKSHEALAVAQTKLKGAVSNDEKAYAFALLAQAYLDLRRPSEALASAEQILALDSIDPHVALGLKASALKALGQIDDAILANEAQLADPRHRNEFSLGILGELQIRTRRFAEALQTAAELSELTGPNNKYIQSLRQRARLGLGRYSEVLEVIRGSNLNEQASPNNLTFTIEALVGLNQVNVAQKFAERYFLLHPKNETALLLLMKVLSLQSRLHKLVNIANELSKAEPKSELLLWVLFQLERNRNHREPAASLLKDILGKSKTNLGTTTLTNIAEVEIPDPFHLETLQKRYSVDLFSITASY